MSGYLFSKKLFKRSRARKPRRPSYNRALILENLEDRCMLAQFDMVFLPDTIGPGSVSMLQYTVTNDDLNNGITDVDFTNVLPAGVTVAGAPGIVFNGTGTLTAAGNTITLEDMDLGPGASEVFSVNVTGPVGSHANSADLLVGGVVDDNATDTLDVVTNLPGFSMEFDDATIELGQRTILTYTIDNSSNPSNVLNLDFTHTLPTGLEIAGPANVALQNIGTAALPATVTAAPGGNTVVLDANGVGAFPAIAAATIGTISVDVVSTSTGIIETTTGDLLANFVSAGKAADFIQVNQPDDIHAILSFTDDPVPPGGNVIAEIFFQNFDRNFEATNINFSVELGTLISGISAVGVPANVLNGGTLDLSGNNLTVTNGTLSAGASETVPVTLQIPATTAPGAFDFTTSSLSADIDGSTINATPVIDTLFVTAAPVLEMEFQDNPIGAGGTSTLEFTLTNTSETSTASDIEFNLNLEDVLGGTQANLGGAIFSGFDVNPTLAPLFDGIDVVGFQATGGTLAISPSFPGNPTIGTISVDLTIPQNSPAGTFTFTTSPPTATVGGFTEEGQPASDDLDVAAAPDLTISFTDPVLPGDTTDLEFTLSNPAENVGAATDIEFTLDLNAVIAGLQAVGLPLNNVGGGGTLAGSVGDTFLTFSNGTIAAGATETFDVTVQLPANAPPGSHTATTSNITADVAGVATTGDPASDDLDVVVLTFEHEFTDPVVAGQTTQLTYSFENLDPGLDATSIFFTHNLGSVIPGLAAVAPLPTDPLGAGSSITGTTFLIVTGGEVLAGQQESFSVDVLVPPGAATDSFNSTTSSPTFTFNSGVVVGDPSTDNLDVVDAVSISKTFLPDTVAPGDTTILEYTIINNLPDFSLSNITFMDDLESVISGLDAINTPVNQDGFQVDTNNSGLLTVNGALAAGGQATFQVELAVPGPPLTAGTFISTTTNITGDVDDGVPTPFTVSGATDELTVTADPDFGDAPDTYSTGLISDGARHLPGGPRLGDLRDFEPDASTPLDGTGDDVTGDADEDGVTIPTLGIGQTVQITVEAPDGGQLDAFIDFNGDGDFDEGDEKILDDETLLVGTNNFNVAIPATAVAGGSFARFRVSTAGGLGFDGEAPDGEVEDYAVTLEQQDDFGDAPDTYSTLRGSDGARHTIIGPTLGALRDAEADAAAPLDGTGDDVTGDADEDGVTLPVFLQGQAVTVTVNAPAGGQLDAFIDFNGDGDFDEANEKVFDNETLAAGNNDLIVNVPADAVSGDSFARFRVSTTGGLSFDGAATDGEVEDYSVQIGPNLIIPTLVEGQNIITVENVTPGAIVGFALGTAPGTTELPQFGVTLDIAAAQIFGVGVADASGTAIAILNLTAAQLAQNFFFQAFEASPSPVVTPVEQQASPLLADDGEGPGAAPITQADLDAMVAAAKQCWIDAGLTADQIDLLDTITFELGDLPDGQIGQATGTAIIIDPTAAGNGWFVDPTPDENSEFGIVVGATELQAAAGSPAEGLLDLLTTVKHEIGHVLGFGDVATTGSGESLMAESLADGSRRLPVVPQSLTIDNGDPGHTEAGAWADSGLTGSNGSSTRFSSSAAATARWTPTGMGPGTYKVSIFKVVHSNSSTDVEVTVNHNGQVETFNLDYTAGSSGFVELGEFEFSGDGTEFVEIRNAAGSGILRADAVEFESQSSSSQTLSSELIDNGDPGHSETGTWFDSGLTGNNGSSTRFASSPAATARWTPDISSGVYRVSIFRVAHSNASTNVEVTVSHNGQVETFNLDYTDGPSGFVELGDFDFIGDGTEFVEIRNAAGTGNLRADAVQFENLLLPAPAAPAAPPLASQTIDNGDAGHTETGAWFDSGLTGIDGSSTRFASSAAATARWTPNITAGVFRVSIFKVAHSNSSTDVEVTVNHNGQVTTFNLDYTDGPSGFVELGNLEFSGDGTEFVEIRNAAGTGILRADAVRFDDPPPFTQLIDNGEAGHSETGAWFDSGLTGNGGSSTRFASSAAATARWTPTLSAGTFTVSIFKVAHSNSSTDVEVTVNHNGQVTTFNLDYTDGPSGFVELGDLEFSGDGTEFVEIRNAAGTGILRADAVEFVQVPNPLLAAGEVEGTSGGPSLTAAQLDPIVQFAAAQWMATTSGTLYDLEVRVEDLPGARLGEALGNTITLDVNAAGYGWFVDDTPETDEEFGSSDGAAAGKMDLLTVVFHEMGHLLGYGDDYSDPSSNDVMNGWLPTGVRREPTTNDLDALFGDETEMDELFQL